MRIIDKLNDNPLISIIVICSLIIPATVGVTTWFYQRQLDNIITKCDAEKALLQNKYEAKIIELNTIIRKNVSSETSEISSQLDFFKQENDKLNNENKNLKDKISLFEKSSDEQTQPKDKKANINKQEIVGGNLDVQNNFTYNGDGTNKESSSNGQVVFVDGSRINFISLVYLTSDYEFEYRKNLNGRNLVKIRFSDVSKIEFFDLSPDESAIAKKGYMGIMKRMNIVFRDGSMRKNIYTCVARWKWKTEYETGDCSDASTIILK